MAFIKRLIWDEWNTAHIARHDVMQEEVKQVALGDVLIQKGKKGRTALVGPTDSGRMLRVILDPEGKDIYYPVTAHTASRKDRALYKQEKEGEKFDKTKKSDTRF